MPKGIYERKIKPFPKSKMCTGCRVVKRIGDFANDKAVKSGKDSRCKACLAVTYMTWSKSNRDARRINERNYARRRRIECLKKYGNHCKCCGEKENQFLCIDHVDGMGAQHRREIRGSIYLWLKKKNYPTGFQLLCHNCNMAKSFYGECPHKNK